METAHALKVFLVDDSAPIRERMAGLIGGMQGIDIVGQAGTAADATMGILDSGPDAVLLDLQLAGSTGFDVLKAVHPVKPDIVFIVLTNHSNLQYRRLCIASGAQHFLDKSNEFNRVTAILAELRASHASH